METGDYRHLLLAVDFEKQSDAVVQRAQRLRQVCGARLTLLHVIEHIPPTMEYMSLGYSGEITLPETQDLEQELLEVAKRQMDCLGEQVGVGADDRLIRIGSTAHVIDEAATELGADLIVIGSHGHSGLLQLFGSTARAVLRHSGCDVLCVKIDDADPDA